MVHLEDQKCCVFRQKVADTKLIEDRRRFLRLNCCSIDAEF
uniref:Uncharacterized protein n=1 Tax=Arundo donax TaxID=35708 RepID=A0A0A9CCD0_ARUDO